MRDIGSPGASPPAPTADPLAWPGDGARWTRALGIVAGLHAVPILIAAYWLGPVPHIPAAEPAVLVELAPAAVPERPVEPTPQPPEPVTRPERPRAVVEAPREAKIVEPVPAAQPAVTMPVRRPVEESESTRETAPPPPRPAPPPPRPASGQPTWQGMLLGHLDRHKRYPRDAQLRRSQGVPWIRFVIDREGRVRSVNLERSSGFRSLDAEAIALPRRAEPLPKPPAEVDGQVIELVVPVEFFLR